MVTISGSTAMLPGVDELAEIVTRNACDGQLPATLPVHYGDDDGLVIGTAVVTRDGEGLLVTMRIGPGGGAP